MPMALFIYRTVFKVEFVTQLHVLAIYLVLGIGADDLFGERERMPPIIFQSRIVTFQWNRASFLNRKSSSFNG